MISYSLISLLFYHVRSSGLVRLVYQRINYYETQWIIPWPRWGHAPRTTWRSNYFDATSQNEMKQRDMIETQRCSKTNFLLINEKWRNYKNVEGNKLALMAAACLWEEMCRICAFAREKYKEVERYFNIKHIWKETVSITLEYEVLKSLWASRWLVDMSTLLGCNFCIRSPFGALDRLV